MKSIGEKLKAKREENGVLVEEAADDLKLRVSQIENIESGNISAFKDVFYLKYFIRDYAKYLGLDSEKLVDEFNEFLFDYTSKIPVEEIEKANRERQELERQNTSKIVSPYTINTKKYNILNSKLFYIIIGILILLIIYFLINIFGSNNKNDNLMIRFSEVQYESSK